jgi:hypothetical protein
MITRGSQDSHTGYGKKWSVLRNLPGKYIQNFLESAHRAYFNFEHEESIGQPNWSLARGKPWYKLQSYEWPYDQGSIGAKLTTDQWKESQAWQAFSAWESMKKQRILDYDGFSWCCLHGGANMATYKKPLVDALGHAKLSFYVNQMIFQRTVAGSANVDVVYGPGDSIRPVIMNLDEAKEVDLIVKMLRPDGEVVEEKTYENIALPAGRSAVELSLFKPEMHMNGYCIIIYQIVQ